MLQTKQFTVAYNTVIKSLYCQGMDNATFIKYTSGKAFNSKEQHNISVKNAATNNNQKKSKDLIANETGYATGIVKVSVFKLFAENARNPLASPQSTVQV
jgi:hypothetical protein